MTDSEPKPRGYSDLAALFYTDIHLSQFLLSQAHEAPIDFHQTCLNEGNFTGCKLIDEQPIGAGYSVRWQGILIVPDDGEYIFKLADVDDGARLYLDGELVTDWGWNFPSPDVRSTPYTITLTAGEYPIIVDFMQRPPMVASLEVRWSGPTFADEIIPVAGIEKIKDRDKGECPICSDEVQGSAGDPINTYHGNFSYRATDLSLPTVGQSLKVERTYNTLFLTDTRVYTQLVGYGWIHNYNVHLTLPADLGGEENTVILNTMHGSRLRFTIDGNEYVPDPGIQATLISTLNDPKVYTVTAAHQETYVFTATGQMIAYYDTKGNQTAYTYQDERLSRITDVGSGRWLDFGYDDQARLTSVTDPISRSVRYGYDLNGDLSVVTDTRGLTWTYVYTGAHLLSTIIDPDGRIVERVFYDTQARAVRQEDGLGNPTVQLEYALGGGMRVITEAGKTTTDIYDVEAVLVGRSDAQGNTQDYVLNDNLLRESVSDANGNATRFARTALGLTTAITDAQGEVTTMTYDDLNNLTQMTDARGVTTAFTYSGTFLTRRTDALGNTWIYTPTTDGRNLLAAEEAPGGRVTQYEYDQYGQRSAVTDTLQNVTRSAYDPIGRLITTTDAAGLMTLNTYDNADHLVAVTRNYTSTSAQQNYRDAYNLITRYQYDGFGRQIAVTDTVGHVTRNFYDGAGRLVSMTVNYSPTVGPNYQNLYNFTTSYGYDSAGRQSLVTDTLGTATRTAYDNLSRPVTVTQNYKNGIFDPLFPDEDLASITHYDAVGNPIEQIDPAGRINRTYYDNLNRVISTTANYTTTTSQPGYLNLYNLITWYGYDEVGRQVAITDTQGRVTRNYYDVLGRAISTTQNYRADVGPNYLGQYNLTIFNEYNTLGQRVAVSDALAHPTHYTYDAMGRMIQTQDALGGSSETAYDRLGRRFVVTDALQHTTVYTYDAAGRLSQGRMRAGTSPLMATTCSDARSSSPIRWAMRPARSTTLRDGWSHHQCVIGHDDYGVRCVRSRPAHAGRARQLDGLSVRSPGRTVVMTDATSAVLRTQYDRAGNRIKTTDALSHTTVYTYDLAGRLIAQADSVGNTTRYTYDVAGNRLQTIDANGVATGYGYDSLDRLIVVTKSLTGTLGLDPARYNVVTRYGYDALGNRTVMTNARGYTTTYAYDALSRMSRMQDARGKATTYAYDAVGNRTIMTDANGQVTLYTYDTLNRPSLTTYVADGQTVRYAYDAVGNRTVMTDSLGTTRYLYDELNRLKQVTDPFTGTVQYRYDANGNRTQLIYPDGQVVTYTYDAGNRLSNVLDWTGKTTTYQYDQAGRLSTVQLPNGIKTTYTYDAADRLIRLTHTRNSVEMIGDYQFVLDGVGNRLTVTETLLPAGTGSQMGALPPTFAAKVIAAVTGWRAPGLSAPSFLTTTLANTDKYLLAGASLSDQPILNETLSSPSITPDQPTANPIGPADDQASMGHFASDEQWRETTRQEATAPTAPDVQQSRSSTRLLAPLAQGVSGLDRREENDASIVYGPSAWTRTANNRMSRGYYNGANTAGRTASLTFTGSWVGLGF